MDKKVDFRINNEKCTGCGLCQLACSIVNHKAYGYSDAFVRIDRVKDESYEVKFTDDCTSCGLCLSFCAYEAIQGPFEVPCTHACPAGIDMPLYFRYMAKEDFAEALAVIQENNPFPAITGRVCFHPCEPQCWLGRAEKGEAISVRALERFVADRNATRHDEPKARPSSKHVAIVGSGPTGLSAAYYLAKSLGHRVTIFEALPKAGGMLRIGIPAYRLPRDIVDHEIDRIRGLGVEIKTGTAVQSLGDLCQRGYDAIFVAAGARRGMKLSIKGEKGAGVMDCLSFLAEVNQGMSPKVGEKVVIVGGGNSAIHTSRTARRLDASEVSILYRRRAEDMPADKTEIREAIREGVSIQELVMPVGISKEGDRVKLECIRTRAGKKEADGRPRPEPVEGNEFSLEADTVIAAIGETPQLPRKFGLSVTKKGMVAVDPNTLATSRNGVFAGGDVVTGPSSVAEAISAGRRAANSVDKYLGGRGLAEHVPAPIEQELETPEAFEGLFRPKMPSLSIAKRLNSFGEVELGLARKVAIEESKRCLRCIERKLNNG